MVVRKKYLEIKMNKDKVLCYVKCYGGYVLAVGAGCTFGASLVWGTLLLVGAGIWAYQVRRCKPGKLCKK